MKQFYLLILLLCVGYLSFAQDLIILRDATEIEAKVIEIRENDVAYKKWDFQDGPNYSIRKIDILFIKYSNGTKEVYNASNEPQTKTVQSSAIQTTPNVTNNQEGHAETSSETKIRPFNKKTLFNAYAEVGGIFSRDLFAPGITFSLGVKIKDYVFTGISIGTEVLCVQDHYYGEMEYYGMLLPIGGNIRGYYPVDKDFSPFIDFFAGANIWFIDDIYITTARIRIGAGFEWKRLVLGMGYNVEISEGVPLHCGYFKLGVKIGKRY